MPDGGVAMPDSPAVPTVLIVDDDALTRSVLADLLKGDCRLLLARDGASALATLARQEVHLVLLDVSMGDMSGYEVLARMKADERSCAVPVIFITAMSEEAEEERGLLLGAADYVQKPIRPAIVRARVLTHLKLSLQRRELALMAARDGLTGIASRRAFDEALERATGAAVRHGTPLSLGLFDVDHFKLFNDRYGHGAGDDVLRHVAAILVSAARRAEDMVARYGGEEFVLLMPGARDLGPQMEAARRAVEAAGIAHAASPTSGIVTISGGGMVHLTGSGISARQLLERADEMLYRAKADGRNRVLIAGGA